MVGDLIDRVNVTCLVNLGKSSKEAHSLLQQAYGDECMSYIWNFYVINGTKKVEKKSITIYIQDILHFKKRMKAVNK